LTPAASPPLPSSRTSLCPLMLDSPTRTRGGAPQCPLLSALVHQNWAGPRLPAAETHQWPPPFERTLREPSGHLQVHPSGHYAAEQVSYFCNLPDDLQKGPWGVHSTGIALFGAAPLHTRATTLEGACSPFHPACGPAPHSG
jgi:hypothetical protein